MLFSSDPDTDADHSGRISVCNEEVNAWLDFGPLVQALAHWKKSNVVYFFKTNSLEGGPLSKCAS